MHLNFTFSIADGSLPEPGVSGPQDAGPSSGKHELYLTNRKKKKKLKFFRKYIFFESGILDFCSGGVSRRHVPPEREKVIFGKIF